MDLNFDTLTTAISNFAASDAVVNTEIENAIASGDYNKQLNDRLLYTERYFIGLGLPQRPYYKHVVQAPGLYQGYAPQIFPGITQAIQNDNASVAQAQIQLTSFFINKAANF